MEFTKYNHLIEEKKIYDFWEKNNLFKPNQKNQKKLFNCYSTSNITGRLHMGHALNNSFKMF